MAESKVTRTEQTVDPQDGVKVTRADLPNGKVVITIEVDKAALVRIALPALLERVSQPVVPPKKKQKRKARAAADDHSETPNLPFSASLEPAGPVTK